jgi:hypothetical protein
MGDRHDTLELVRSTTGRQVLSVVLATLVADTLGEWTAVAVTGRAFELDVFVVLVAALTVGTVARWGTAGGFLASGMVGGDWTAGVIAASGAFVATTVCVYFWFARERTFLTKRWIGGYAVVACITSLTLSLVVAWLRDFTGLGPFSIWLPGVLQSNALCAVLGFPFVLAVYRRLGAPPDFETALSSTRRFRLTALVVVTGSFGMYLTSLFALTVGRVPPATFGRRTTPIVETVVVTVGPAGSPAVVALGVLFVVTLAFVLRR